MNYSIDWDGPGERDDPIKNGLAECQICGEWYRVTAPSYGSHVCEMDDAYSDWLTELDEDVIQGEFGYEPGEFTVYSSHWRPLFDEGLSPREAWQRALDGFAHAREDERREREERYARIVSEDEAAVAEAKRQAARKE